jgi:ATP-binding cassette, subfamily B, bacterial
VDLLLRFVDPAQGSIKIDGRDLRSVTLESLRTQIAVVRCDDLVFNDTVLNNIGCGDTGYSVPQVIEAAKLAHAHQFIQRLPYGYETVIGNLGFALKLGERYRIALARAILRDPAVLIIEEPQEPLDDDTKTLIDDTLNRVVKGKTVIFLPHRISTVNRCDGVLVLHEGRVHTAGVHKELLKTNALYRHLYYVEYNEFAGEA